jgi:predicted nucleotidyltransferase
VASRGTIEHLNEDFRDLLVALAREGVEFLIVGAYAIAFHGIPRTTGDIDVFVRPAAGNAARTWKALVAFGAPLEANAVTESDFAVPGAVYQIGLPPRRIDVMTEISGVDFEEAWASRVATELDGVRVHFIGKDALLKNKRAAGRAKDLADLERLTRS